MISTPSEGECRGIIVGIWGELDAIQDAFHLGICIELHSWSAQKAHRHIRTVLLEARDLFMRSE